jgi:hypothetical protein
MQGPQHEQYREGCQPACGALLAPANDPQTSPQQQRRELLLSL